MENIEKKRKSSEIQTREVKEGNVPCKFSLSRKVMDTNYKPVQKEYYVGLFYEMGRDEDGQ